MWIRTTCNLSFQMGAPTPLILMLRPRSGLQQWVAREAYTLTPSVPVVEYTDIFGNLCQRLVASEAYQQVEEIRGAADAKATEIYARAYNQSAEAVEFYEFTRTMQSYQAIIADNTTLVLSTDSDLFKFLKGMRPGDAAAAARAVWVRP